MKSESSFTENNTSSSYSTHLHSFCNIGNEIFGKGGLMPERKPSWLCRACKDKFHVACLNPSSCQFDEQTREEVTTQTNHIYVSGIAFSFDPDKTHNGYNNSGSCF